MKNLLPILVIVFLSAANTLAQIAAPSATPPPADDADVVKISTALIQIDVTVTDKSGKIIPDLRRDEIEIYENGEKQDISGFSFISNVRNAVEKGKVNTPAIPLPPTSVRPEEVRRTIALVVDDLTLSFESTHFVRRALKKFVDEQMQEGDLVAIIRTGAGIGALQQFTTDRRQLYAAIEKVRWNASGAGKIGAFAPLQARIDTGEEETEPVPGERTPEGIERENNDFRQSIFATGTLGAVNYVVRGMADLPGRKSVMLLSDGFKLFTKDAGGFVESGRVLESLRRLVDQANRASVVVYTMDARGLQVTGIMAADDTGGRSAEQIQQAASDRRDELLDTQDGLRYLARQTGGISIINNNDLSGGIRRILDDQSYYLVGYEPDAETFDPKKRRFNKLDVRVTRPGARVRYRSGFFGISDENIVRPKETGNQRLLTALTSPFAVNYISLRLNALFGSDARNGSFVRSLLHVTAKDLTFTAQPDGMQKAVFDVLAVGFGDNGAAVDQISNTYALSVDKHSYSKFMNEGFVYDFTFPIKKPGAYQLRVALRDHGSEKVGSANQFVEVPNLKKNRLTLSGVALESIPYDTWQNRNTGNAAKDDDSNPLSDTSLRQFKRGTVLNYGFTIYNAKLPANLTSQVRLFLDGRPIFEGKPQPVSLAGQTDPRSIPFAASLSLGTALANGEYVLQIVITDNMAKEKRKIVNQFVQFEIVD
ncbi:MAG: VWA domain-containing protein [Saprospiraceae bacterium]|nr:VWA domain-containing protein [Pyrinomonadaceae bacterium]